MPLITVTAKKTNRRPPKNSAGDSKTFASELITNLEERTVTSDDTISSTISVKRGNGESTYLITETVAEVVALTIDPQQ